jgi:hypothetical protein
MIMYRCINNYFGYCKTEPCSNNFMIIPELIHEVGEPIRGIPGHPGTKTFGGGTCKNNWKECAFYKPVEPSSKPPVDLAKEAAEASAAIQAKQEAPAKKARKKKVTA